jgi:hypothetical protein
MNHQKKSLQFLCNASEVVYILVVMEGGRSPVESLTKGKAN